MYFTNISDMARRTLRRGSNKKRLENNKVLSQPTYLGENDIPTTVELVQYGNKSVLVKILSTQQELRNEFVPDGVNWVRVTGFSDVAYLAKIFKQFGLHNFDVKDLLADQRVAKVALYDNVTFVLTSGFYLDQTDYMDDMQVAFIVGSNYVISLKEASIPVFDEIKRAIEDNNMPLKEKGADFLLSLLLSAINSLNMNTLMKMEDGLTEIEDRLIDQQNEVDIQHFLRRRRLDYTHIKRSIISFREEYNNLLYNTNKLIKDENMVYFNDYDDRLRTTLGNTESLSEALASLLDVYYNNNNLKLNEIIKRLTIISTIFIPLTFMVGVWGMNFKFMPELEWEYGYLVSWGVFVLIAGFAGYWMKKKKWF